MASLYARYVPPKKAARPSQPEEPKIVPVQASQLYARYVPPKAAASDISHAAEEKSTSKHAGKKRKRGGSEAKSENHVITTTTAAPLNPTGSQLEAAEDLVQEKASSEQKQLATTKKVAKKSKRDRKSDQENEIIIPEPDAEDDDEASAKKYSTVMSKFQKSTRAAAMKSADQTADLAESTPPPELHDLVPIPAPEPAPGAAPFSALSALPTWLSKPVEVSTDSTAPFEELHVDAKLVKRLHGKGITKALPVQTGVLPLLMPTPSQHPGDICVSAATGSGKTLAYVLPIVQSLQTRVSVMLRAVIVVPTRELVKQVWETTEMCIAGTDLVIGTALGTHAFEAEKDALVKRGTRFNPSGYKAMQERLARKNTVENFSEDDNEERDLLLSFDPTGDLLPYHTLEYTSKVDILICTPGRLVEHIKSTPGFTLENLRWLIIDEADRLLDQSFQEWVDVIQTAILRPPADLRPRRFVDDPFYESVFSPLPRQRVRKVVLSATMTRDLEQLASLKLRNPKMIVVQGAQSKGGKSGAEEEVPGALPGDLNLPPNLQEFAVPVGDGSEKPLFLLKLLQQIFEGHTSQDGTKEKGRRSSAASISSSASSSASESSSESDDVYSVVSDSSDASSEASSVVSSSSDASESSSESNSDSSSDVASSEQESDDSSESASVKPSSQSEQRPTTTTSAPSHPNVLIFTSTNESAHRLHHLLATLSPSYSPNMHLLTAATPSRKTRNLLRSFLSPRTKNNHPQILIATDRASRGLDLPNLTHVINYDIPRSVKIYVHRVGRTARAGRSGETWTLVAEREAAWFWNVIARGKGEERIGRGEKVVERVRVDLKWLEEGVRERYEGALGRLREDVEGGGRA